MRIGHLKKKVITRMQRWMKKMPAERLTVITTRWYGMYWVVSSLLCLGGYSVATALNIDLSQVVFCGLTVGSNDRIALQGIIYSLAALVLAFQYKHAQAEYWDYLLLESNEQTDGLK